MKAERENIDQICQQVAKELVRAMPTLVKVFEPIAQSFLTAGEKAYQLVWQVYLQAGCPYGETEKGLQVWLENKLKAGFNQ